MRIEWCPTRMGGLTASMDRNSLWVTRPLGASRFSCWFHWEIVVTKGHSGPVYSFHHYFGPETRGREACRQSCEDFYGMVEEA